MATGELEKKRKYNEWEVSKIEVSKAAIIHGIVMQLSPVRVSKRMQAYATLTETLLMSESLPAWFHSTGL